MAFQLSLYEQARVFDALQDTLSYDQLSPAERHQFVLNFTFGDEQDPLVWTARQADTDAGTALALYWHLSPAYWSQYASAEEASADVSFADYQLLKEIEANYLAGFYLNRNYSFDPSEFIAEGGAEEPADGNELMRRASPGARFARQDPEVVLFAESGLFEGLASGELPTAGLRFSVSALDD
ncbi:DUF4274 domain-containing protein [Kitasatospora azatica]|uniref:DUF4274 domain-containing protein n=1 Tax=Kitasatospora azatica TaxID=58347 RepID=UPI00068A90E7|nr:DUF4274 domain-containing protein [Kitasatospora azatica]